MGFSGQAVDTISTATPLLTGQEPLLNLFIGNIPGVLGETSKIAILLGGIYLLIRRVIDWRIPFFFIATLFVCYLTHGAVSAYNNALQTVTLGQALEAGVAKGLYQVLSGGLLLSAFFMATDYVTAPVSKLGKIIMAIGCGGILYVIRAFATYPDGCSFAILFMNVCTPLIDKFTIPKNFGEVTKRG